MPNDYQCRLFPIGQEGFLQDFLEWVHYHPENPGVHIPALLRTFGQYFSVDIEHDVPIKEANPLLSEIHKIVCHGYRPEYAKNVITQDLKSYLEVSLLDDDKKSKIYKTFENMTISSKMKVGEIEKTIPEMMSVLDQGEMPVAVLICTFDPGHGIGCIFDEDRMILSNFGYGSFDFISDDCDIEVGLKVYKINKKITSDMLSELLSIQKNEDLPNRFNNFSESKLHSIFGLELMNTIGGGTPQKARNCAFKDLTPLYKAGLYLMGASEEEVIFEHQNFMENNREIWLDHMFCAISNVKNSDYETELLFIALITVFKIKYKQVVLNFKKEKDIEILDKIKSFVEGLKQKGNSHHYLDKILEFISGENMTTCDLTNIHQVELETTKKRADRFHKKWSQKAKLHQRLYQMLNQTMDGVRNKAAGWVSEQFEALTSGVLKLCASNLQGRTHEITG
ncbi:MAG: hypothetical protein S4CHLAM123_15460 [Chlamydiales bacterium]|nr:hypothetical protein [Chlamydiales bacterium]